MHFIMFESWLYRTIIDLLGTQIFSAEQNQVRESLIDDLYRCWDGLDDYKESEWIRQTIVPREARKNRFVNDKLFVPTSKRGTSKLTVSHI